MAKQKSTLKAPTRRQVARREKEEKLNRILVWSTIGVVAVILLIIGYGLITELVVKTNKPVARMDDVVITTQQFQRRLYYERLLMRQQLNNYQSYLAQIDPTDETMQGYYQQFQSAVTDLESQLSASMASVVGQQVLDNMLEEELVRKEAQARNLTVSQDDVDMAIEQIIGYDRTAAETVTDTTTIESFDTLYQNVEENFLKPSHLTEQDFRTMVETSLLRDRLIAAIGEGIPQTSDQVDPTFFAVDNEEIGLALRERIELGEEPAALIEEFNNDDNDLTAGYQLSWLPDGYLSAQLGAEIEQVTFNTPVGQASNPTLGSDGQYYVIYINGHEERPVDEATMQQMLEDQYSAWLEPQKAERWEYLDWETAVLTKP
ncbi:MAG: SurA N-terminal domain-containing protein [Anaerolineae bacterium]|nr:SurA N-terminal domain-containing protein [Anaerolineae bacterium]